MNNLPYEIKLKILSLSCNLNLSQTNKCFNQIYNQNRNRVVAILMYKKYGENVFDYTSNLWKYLKFFPNNRIVVKYLVEAGADIDYALIRNAKNGHLESVKYLVENGTNHDENIDALIMSAKNGHLEIVKYLVENGVDIHVYDDCALKYSAENGHLEIVKYLTLYKIIHLYIHSKFKEQKLFQQQN